MHQIFKIKLIHQELSNLDKNNKATIKVQMDLIKHKRQAQQKKYKTLYLTVENC